MAVTTENPTPIIDTVAARFGNFLVWLGDMSAGAKAAKHAAALSRMSDEQLASRGLKREEIVEHAFEHLVRG